MPRFCNVGYVRFVLNIFIESGITCREHLVECFLIHTERNLYNLGWEHFSSTPKEACAHQLLFSNFFPTAPSTWCFSVSLSWLSHSDLPLGCGMVWSEHFISLEPLTGPLWLVLFTSVMFSRFVCAVSVLGFFLPFFLPFFPFFLSFFFWKSVLCVCVCMCVWLWGTSSFLPLCVLHNKLGLSDVVVQM